MSCIFCDFSTLFRVPAFSLPLLVALISVMVVHFKKKKVLLVVSLVVVLNGLLSRRKAMRFSCYGAICGFIASRSVYVFTPEVSWQRLLVFLWLMTERERERGGETE